MDIYNGTGRRILIYDLSTCEMINQRLCKVAGKTKLIMIIEPDVKLMVVKENEGQKLLYGKIPYSVELHSNAMRCPNNQVVIVNEDYYNFLKSQNLKKNNVYVIGTLVYDETGKKIVGCCGLVERRL